MALLADENRRQLEESARVKQSFSEALVGRIGQFAEKSASALRNGGKIVFFGNGGSAADALHLAAELVVRLRTDHRGRQRLRLRAHFFEANRIAGRSTGPSCCAFDQWRKRQYNPRGRGWPRSPCLSRCLHGRNRWGARGQGRSTAQRALTRSSANPGSPYHHGSYRQRSDRAVGDCLEIAALCSGTETFPEFAPKNALHSEPYRTNSYFALFNSTLAVANGMIASRSTGVRATLFAIYIVNCASFISSPFSKT
jgi:hypothetical protein